MAATNRTFTRAAHGLDLPTVEGSQEHGLDLVGDLADLVEEEDATIGGSEIARLILVCPAERAANVAKKLRVGRA